MKTRKLLLAVALAALGVVLMASIVAAAPASTTGVQTSQVFDSPILTGTTPILTGTMPMTHPVGLAIALYFHIPYTEVMALHQEGLGFGNIARAFLTAAASQGALTPTHILDMRQAGMGWGQIKKEFDVSPGGNGLGTIMRNKPVAPAVMPETPTNVDTGKGNHCPGNSCSAPGQNKSDKGPKPDMPKGPKNK